MGMCWHIACNECRKSLWIGQARSNGIPYIYTADAEVMAGLAAFLIEHRGHPLEFNYNECISTEWEMHAPSLPADDIVSPSPQEPRP